MINLSEHSNTISIATDVRFTYNSVICTALQGLDVSSSTRITAHTKSANTACTKRS